MSLDGLAPVNGFTAIVDRATGFVTTYYQQFVQTVLTRLQLAPYVRAAKQLVAQAAAIATTAAFTTTAEGLYRISYIVRVTQAATTSSSVQVTIGWSRSGVAQSEVGALVNGNTTATHETKTYLVRANSVTDLTFAVAYTSVGGTPMQFEIDVTVEQVN